MNFIRKTLIWFFIVSLAIPSNFALAFSYPSPTEALDEILGDLGINKDALKKTVSVSNVASYKKNPPTVTLTYIPENPVPGKELTVMAVPSYFIGNPDQMYYTWQLKRAAKTDWNRNGKTDDIEDYKIEAMRILARGNTEEEFVYSGSKSGEAEKEDGYEAFFGGEDQKGKSAHCFVRDIASGVDYEIGIPGKDPAKDAPTTRCEHVFPKKYYRDGGEVKIKKDANDKDLWVGTTGKFTLEEEAFWGTDPHSADTNNDGVPDEQALTGKGMMAFTWIYQEGDEIGVAVEGVQESTDYSDSSMKTMWAMSGETCEIANPNNPVEGGDKRNVYRFSQHGAAYLLLAPPPLKTKISIDCVNMDEPEEYEFINPGGIIGKATNEDDPHCAGGLGTIACEDVITPSLCGRCYFNDGKNTWKGGGDNSKVLTLIIDPTYGDGACETYLSVQRLSPITGLLEYVEVEQGYWKGKMNYEELARPSSDTNINDCFKGSLTKPALGTGHKKIEINLSHYPQNPINDPTGTNSDELTIKANLVNIEDKSFVKYNWTFFSCDSMNGTSCTPINKNDLISNDPVAKDNPLISKDPINKNDLKLSRTTGLGLDTIKIKLQLTDVTYLKASLVASEDTAEVTGKEGRGHIIIPLQTSNDRLMPMKVAVDAQSNPLKLIQSGERYPSSDACPGKVCPAVKDEIIGLKYTGNIGEKDELSWYLNGQALLTAKNAPVAYFPIFQNTNTKYSVKLDITREKEKISLLQDFEVEEPSVVIMPGCGNEMDCIAPKKVVLGKFIDPTDPKNEALMEADYSQDLFEAKKDSTITLSPTFNFELSILKKTAGKWSFNWIVDNVLVDQNNTDPLKPIVDPSTGNLNLPIQKAAGEKYQISIQTLYAQTEINKRALHKIWNHPTDSFYEKNISDSAEILVVSPSTLGQAETKKIIASLFSDLPEYLNFLFRIFVTMALLLFLANLSLVTLPRRNP